MIQPIHTVSSDLQYKPPTKPSASNHKDINTESFQSVLERHMKPHELVGVVVDQKAHVVTAMKEYVPLVDYVRYE